jgi:uncharacterized protein
MKLEGDYLFQATVDEVWSALFDPVILAAVMPGCEKLELVDGQYVGEIKVKVGPVQGKFTGKVDLKDKIEPKSYTMVVDGRGAPGFVKATALVKLAAEGDATRVSYDTDAQVGGKIASVGQRLLEASARAIVAQSLEGLHTNIKLRAKVYREAGAKQAVAEVVSANAPAAGVEAGTEAAAQAATEAAAATGTATAAATATETAAAAGTGAPAATEAAATAGTGAAAPAATGAATTAVTGAAATAGTGAATATGTASGSEASPATGAAAAAPAATTADSSTAASTSPADAARPAKPGDLAVSFTPVKVTQSALANAVAKEVASSLFPRSVLVAIILIQALVIVWLLVR